MYSMKMDNPQKSSRKNIMVLFSYVAFVTLTFIFIISVSIPLFCGFKILFGVISLTQYLHPILIFELLLANITLLHDRGSKKYYSQIALWNCFLSQLSEERRKLWTYTVFPNYVITFTDAICFSMWTWNTIWGHLLSAWRTSFGISFKIG